MEKLFEEIYKLNENYDYDDFYDDVRNSISHIVDKAYDSGMSRFEIIEELRSAIYYVVEFQLGGDKTLTNSIKGQK